MTELHRDLQRANHLHQGEANSVVQFVLQSFLWDQTESSLYLRHILASFDLFCFFHFWEDTPAKPISGSSKELNLGQTLNPIFFLSFF